MHHTKQPGKNALKVKAIEKVVKAKQSLKYDYTFVLMPDGSAYFEVDNKRVPEKEFEQLHSIALLKNQEMQNVTIDPRHII